MASNRIKNLVINIETLNDQIAEAIQIAIENISIDNLGEDGTTEFDIENVEVVFIEVEEPTQEELIAEKEAQILALNEELKFLKGE